VAVRESAASRGLAAATGMSAEANPVGTWTLAK